MRQGDQGLPLESGWGGGGGWVSLGIWRLWAALHKAQPSAVSEVSLALNRLHCLLPRDS